ncbi:MAG: DUF2892 domain-containing protein [Syntrophothermus sp.]
MNTNVGPVDRIMRLLIGSAFLIASAFAWVPRPWRALAIAIGFAESLVAVTGFSPLWALLGISTKPQKQR